MAGSMMEDAAIMRATRRARATPSQRALRRTASGRSRNVYALQRRIGFRWLSFIPELELEFQASFSPLVRLATRHLFLLSVVCNISYIALSLCSAHPWLTPRSLAVALPLVVVLLVPPLLSLRERASDYFQAVVFACIFLYAVGITALVVLGRSGGQPLPISELILIVVANYCTFGLRLWQVALISVSLSLNYLGLAHERLASSEFRMDAFFLVATNMIGGLVHYYFEYSARLNFLLRGELRGLAFYDVLTGLYNRRAFSDHLRAVWRQAERENRSIGVAVIDMDRLKQINDAHGHHDGDQCLRVIGESLEALTNRPLDAAGRLGGDEFAAVWFDVDGEWFMHLGDLIGARIDQETQRQGLRPFTVSVGLARCYPQPGSAPQLLLHQADERMYEVKHTHHTAAG